MRTEELLNQIFIQFSFQLLVSEAAFLKGRQKRERFAIRLVLSLALYFILAYIWGTVMEPLREMHIAFRVASYIGYAVLTAIPVAVSYKQTPMGVLFLITGGYALEHICFAVFRMVQYAGNWREETMNYLLYTLIFRYAVYAVSAVAAYFIVNRRGKNLEENEDGDRRITVLAAIVLVSAVVLSVFYTDSDIAEEWNLLNAVICPLYSIICCILVLVLEFYVLRENRMKREQEMMEQLLHMSDSQQKSSREAINIINMKCHDLKHQMRLLTRIDDEQARKEYLSEMQEAVSIYDAIYHTGNEALDYVLREKTLISNEYKVAFSCMVDGEAIGFMKPADIYALMGNALDNALERVVKEPEEQRVISLRIRRQKRMVLIHMENRCSKKVEFQDGLPVTDKADNNFHGFGVRSIRYITEKYGGELMMDLHNEKFCMDILFPE